MTFNLIKNKIKKVKGIKNNLYFKNEVRYFKKYIFLYLFIFSIILRIDYRLGTLIICNWLAGVLGEKSHWPTARSRESCNRSVKDGCLKLPLLVKVEVFESNVIVTPHSLSLRCFLSRHAAKAHPTAWLKRSP